MQSYNQLEPIIYSALYIQRGYTCVSVLHAYSYS